MSNLTKEQAKTELAVLKMFYCATSDDVNLEDLRESISKYIDVMTDALDNQAMLSDAERIAYINVPFELGKVAATLNNPATQFVDRTRDNMHMIYRILRSIESTEDMPLLSMMLGFYNCFMD